MRWLGCLFSWTPWSLLSGKDFAPENPVRCGGRFIRRGPLTDAETYQFLRERSFNVGGYRQPTAELRPEDLALRGKINRIR